MQPYPPLQTLLAAAVLRRAGFRVEVCDVTLEKPEEKLTSRHATRLAPCLVVVCEDDFNFLSARCACRAIVSLPSGRLDAARDTDAWRAVHGSDSTDHVDRLSRCGFRLRADRRSGGDTAASLPPVQIGAIARVWPTASESGTQRTIAAADCRRTLMRCLPPAWDLIDMERLPERLDSAAWLLLPESGLQPGLSLSLQLVREANLRQQLPCPVATRRCPGDAALSKQHYAPDHIWFADDIFALSARWTREFAGAVQELDARSPVQDAIPLRPDDPRNSGGS